MRFDELLQVGRVVGGDLETRGELWFSRRPIDEVTPGKDSWYGWYIVRSAWVAKKYRAATIWEQNNCSLEIYLEADWEFSDLGNNLWEHINPIDGSRWRIHLAGGERLDPANVRNLNSRP